jgi:hypothetical protein
MAGVDGALPERIEHCGRDVIASERDELTAVGAQTPGATGIRSERPYQGTGGAPDHLPELERGADRLTDGQQRLRLGRSRLGRPAGLRSVTRSGAIGVGHGISSAGPSASGRGRPSPLDAGVV